MSDTGGGHRASARAIGEALDRLHGRALAWQMVDVFADYGPWPLSQVPQLYRPLVSQHLWLWRLLWRLGAQAQTWAWITRAMLAWGRRGLERCFGDHPAELVVSVHPLLNHVPRRWLQRWQPHIPFATVVTDLATAHGTWYDPTVDLLCASCGEVRDAARAAGVPDARIRLLGLPIGLRFLEARGSRHELRWRLGLPDLPAVLVMGGGEGMGPVAEIVEALVGALFTCQAQLIVVCGRNERLRQDLAARTWPIPVQVLGFVANMPQWMGAAECLVTKAGPGTIAEALASGLPLMLSSFVPGQEDGNVGYVVRNGAGAFSQDPAQIARTVRSWLEHGNPALAAMQARARELARPRAALDIASALSELL